MGPHILRVVAFFYLAITTSQATFIHPIGGAIAAAAAGKVMFHGAMAGIGIAGAIHKEIESYWKQNLGENTKMPKGITDCLNKGDILHENGPLVDANSLIRFKSYVDPKSDVNIYVNMTQTIIIDVNVTGNVNGNANGGGGQVSSQQIGKSSKSFYGPPKSSATDMANSYGPPSGNTPGTQVPGSGEGATPQEVISNIKDSISSIFFPQSELSLGKNMNIHFTKTTNRAPLLPREMVEQLPFSLKNLPEILSKLNLTADSEEATIMKESLRYCEDDKPGDKCCNSLEGMVDFATSIVGKNVKAMSNNIDKNVKMDFKVQGIKNIPCGTEAVSCHKIPFPCAAFYCQKIQNMVVSLATLVGTDGSTINAPVVCRKDINSPTNCHFLLDDDVLWISK